MSFIAHEAVIYHSERDELALFTRYYNGTVVVDFGEDFLTSSTTNLKKWQTNGWEVIELTLAPIPKEITKENT